MNLKNIIITWFYKLRQARNSKKYILPSELSPEVMEKIMKEVKFLRIEHDVDVRNLADGEKPSLPKKLEQSETKS